MGFYKGKYFILNSLINPSKGNGPIESGVMELRKFEGKEIILATGTTMTAELTNSYIEKLMDGKVVRLSNGIPMGTMIEFADKTTLEMAFKNRK